MVEQNVGPITSSSTLNIDDRELTTSSSSQILHCFNDKTETSDNEDPNSPDTNESGLSPKIENAFNPKAVQKFFEMSQFNQLSMNNPFANFLQQSHFINMANAFNLNSSISNPSSSRQTPERNDDDCDLENTGEPEDLSLSRRDHNKNSDNDETGSNANSNYTFEEQFKQLYEVNDDPSRKAWLDDWLSFMNKIGKPVTRIPIMAKQTLDLYELYHLVVKHGGLVEVINKKLWREITKGLNLPPSITSAAFTLRSQYHKYLYDYECEKMNMSTVEDLNAAIEANKREGRRNPGPMMSAPNSAGLPGGLMMNGGGPGNAFGNWPMPFFNQFARPFGMSNTDDNPLAALTNNQHALAAAAATAEKQLELLQKAATEATKHQINQNQQNNSGRNSASSIESTKNNNNSEENVSTSMLGGHKRTANNTNLFESQPANKKQSTIASNNSSLSTNMKVITKDNQMFMTMEVNGTVYQGVLLAVDSNMKVEFGNNNDFMTDGMNALSALFGNNLNSE